MASKAHSQKRFALSLIGVLCALTFSQSASAQERVELDQLQATTQALIETLVESGIITREKADQLMAKARAQARAKAQSTAPPDAAEFGKDGKRVVRVPYVPESLKREMRDQIKQEVLLQARNERWGEPAAYPDWLSRIKFDGDLRLREELVRLGPGNSAPGLANFVNGDLTRAADIAQSAINGIPNFNTQSDFDRTRIRARFGATATLSENVSATMRLSTGNLTDRTSTNQTLGQYFNKYQVVMDQAYVTLRPFDGKGMITGGRMPNPFFSTDLVWADDLGFEGIAASLSRDFGRNTSGFLTAGYFPLTENSPGKTSRRSLVGLQSGLNLKLGAAAHPLKLGLALYNYQGVEGQREVLTPESGNTNPEYATQYKYASGFRQRGNTLFNVRAPRGPGDPPVAAIYGLASAFRELNVTATLDLQNVLPLPLRLTGDYVKNLSFDTASIQDRTGVALTDGKDNGFLGKFQVGKNQIAKRGDWNASLAYRYLGSDAVLDAFTNSDFGLGGTNNKGFILGVNYGIYDNTSLSVRLMSSNPIDSYKPGSDPTTQLSTDTIQIDLNARF